MSKQLLTKPSLQSIAIPYRILMVILLLFSVLMLLSFDNYSEKSEHSAEIVFNGEINNESKILRKVEDLPLLLNKWIITGRQQDNFDQTKLINQIETSAYLSSQLTPVLILDPHPESSAPPLSKIYLAVFQLPENKFVKERPEFDKLPEIVDLWNCNFSGSIKSKKEFRSFEISKLNIDRYIAIPYGAQYEADLYWLLSNHDLVYGKF